MEVNWWLINYFGWSSHYSPILFNPLIVTHYSTGVRIVKQKTQSQQQVR